MSKNKVTFGLKNVHVAFLEGITEGVATWAKPEKVTGAVNFTPSAEGESTPFYADDTIYYMATSNNGYTADLEMANFPDEILAKALGWEMDDNGMLVEIADAKPNKFALMGEVQGDVKNRRFVYYDVQANRISDEKATKGDTVEPATKTMPITIMPIEIGEKLIVKGDMELTVENKVKFDTFFGDVYVPTFELAGV